jgi:hypothetical protein
MTPSWEPDTMSAYIVEKHHIVFMVQAAMSRRIAKCGFSWDVDGYHQSLSCTDYNKAVEIANMLWQENIKSVSARYHDESADTLPGAINGEERVITTKDFETIVFDTTEPVQVLKATDCYEYQSCEHDAWHRSAAKQFLDALRSYAWTCVPGYDDAEWGAPKPLPGARNLSAMMAR